MPILAILAQPRMDGGGIPERVGYARFVGGEEST
jgi:hypothetical protein